MKSLVVAFSKLDGNGGGIFATLAYVNAMADIADETVFLFPSDDSKLDGRVSGKVRQIPVADKTSKIGKIARILCKGTLHRFEACFRELLSQERFDVITFHNSKASRGLIDLAHAQGAKVVTFHNNYERDYTRDNVSPFLLPVLIPPTVKAERESFRKSDLNLVVSNKDEELLRAHYGRDCHPEAGVLGVFEYDEGIPVIHEDVDRPVFVITGNLSAKQTLDSLVPWMKRYYPVLLGLVPDARLIVAGKHPGEKLKRLLDRPGIELVDTPENMAEIIARGKYYICPTCKGGGVKLRVMDGLRAGLPVLCHSISARGYEPFADTLLFEYDDVRSFRASLEKMLAVHPDVKSALSLYRNSFSFEAGKARLQEMLYRMMEKRPRVLLLQEVFFQYRIPILEKLTDKYEIEVAYIQAGPGTEGASFPTRCLPSSKRGRIKRVAGLVGICRDYDAVVFQPHLSCIDFCRLPFVRNRSFRCISWDIGVRASYRKKFSLQAPMSLEDRIYRLVMSRCDANLFYMPQMRELWAERGLDPSSLFIAHNTVETLDRPYSAAGRDSYLFVGSLYAEKRVDLLLDAYETAFHQAGGPADFPVLNIVGAGDMESSLMDQAKSLRSSERIVFHHAVFDESVLHELFSKAVLCVSPYQAGLSVLKSFAYGTPFVTRVDAITGGEILNIENGMNGVLYSDDSELPAILLDAYHQRDKYMSMGRKAYEYYRTEASPAVMAEGIADAVNHALNPCRP